MITEYGTWIPLYLETPRKWSISTVKGQARIVSLKEEERSIERARNEGLSNYNRD
jgi:hypothetical protein